MELTVAERKAFVAEVGRLIAKLRENCKTPDDCSLQDGWLIQLAGNSAISQRAAYNWWSAFCRETGKKTGGVRVSATGKRQMSKERGLLYYTTFSSTIFYLILTRC